MKNKQFLAFFSFISLILVGNSSYAMEKSTTEPKSTSKSTLSIAVNPKDNTLLAIARHATVKGEHQNEIGIFDLKTKKYRTEKGLLIPTIEKKLTKVTFDKDGNIVPIFFGNKTYTHNTETRQFDEKDAPPASPYKLVTTEQKDKNWKICLNENNSTLLTFTTDTCYSIHAVSPNKKYIALLRPYASEIHIYQIREGEPKHGHKPCGIISGIYGEVSSLAYVDENTLVAGYTNDTKMCVYTFSQKTPDLIMETKGSRNIHFLYEPSEPKDTFWTWDRAKLLGGIFVTAITLYLGYKKFFS